MKKVSTLAFGSLSLGISFYDYMRPGNYLEAFINSEPIYFLARTLIPLVLLTYVFFPQVRTYATKKALTVFSAGLMLLGAVTLFSPAMFGQLAEYVSIGETLLFLEGGILGYILASELPAHQPRFLKEQVTHFETLLVAQPKKFFPGTSKNRPRLAI